MMLRVALLIFWMFGYTFCLAQPNPLDIFKGVSDKERASITNAYHYAPCLKYVIDHLDSSQVSIDVLSVRMGDLDSGYFVEDSEDKGTMYLNSKNGFDIIQFAEVIYQAYEGRLYGSDYLNNRLSRIEALIFSRIVAKELNEKVSPLQFVKDSKDKKCKKYLDHYHKLINEGYNAKSLMHLIKESDLLAVFESKNNRYLIKDEKIKVNTISTFLASED